MKWNFADSRLTPRPSHLATRTTTHFVLLKPFISLGSEIEHIRGIIGGGYQNRTDVSWFAATHLATRPTRHVVFRVAFHNIYVVFRVTKRVVPAPFCCSSSYSGTIVSLLLLKLPLLLIGNTHRFSNTWWAVKDSNLRCLPLGARFTVWCFRRSATTAHIGETQVTATRRLPVCLTCISLLLYSHPRSWCPPSGTFVSHGATSRTCTSLFWSSVSSCHPCISISLPIATEPLGHFITSNSHSSNGTSLCPGQATSSSPTPSIGFAHIPHRFNIGAIGETRTLTGA